MEQPRTDGGGDVTQITFGSLFAGIGGIDLGFERAGMACKWQVEIDPYAQRVLAKHWPDVRRHDDVRTWPQPDTERVDVIAGGFPCQDISYAGKGAGLAGERSGLFYEVARIVREMGPRVVVLENVAALLTRGMGDVLGTLASLGYDAEWHCIPAAAVGAPHIRDRVFLIAYAKRNGQHEAAFKGCTSKGTKKRRMFKPKRPRGTSRSVCIQCQSFFERFRCNSPDECDCPKCQGTCECGNVSDAASHGWNQRESNGGGSGEGTRSRPQRGLGSFDRWWEVEPAMGRVADGVPKRVDRLRGLGNAVVPQVAELVGRMVVEALNSQPA